MSFKAVSVVLVATVALVTSSSSTKFTLESLRSSKNSSSNISLKAGFANSYQQFFVYNDEPVTFFEAWHKCRSHGLRLAAVHSAMNDLKLKVALAEKDINQRGPWWIAGTDLGKSGSFVWITNNQRIGGLTGYTNFAQGEPNNKNGNEHCLEVGWPSGTLWNDAVCDNKQGYICELDTCDC